jgi:hypothetical protein
VNDADQFLGGVRGADFASGRHHLTVDAIIDNLSSKAVRRWRKNPAARRPTCPQGPNLSTSFDLSGLDAL